MINLKNAELLEQLLIHSLPRVLNMSLLNEEIAREPAYDKKNIY